MDSDSDYERELPDTGPPTPIDVGSFDLLARMIEESQRMHQLKNIKKLATENTKMQNAILQYQELGCKTVELFEKAYQALQTLKRAFGNCVDEDIAAEKDWLTFWGISKQHRGQRYSPAGWI